MVEMSLHEFFGIVNVVGDFIEKNEVILSKQNFKDMILRINDADKYGNVNINVGKRVKL